MLINELVPTKYLDVKCHLRIKTTRERKYVRKLSYIDKKYTVSIFINNEEIAREVSHSKKIAYFTAMNILIDKDYHLYQSLKKQFPFFYVKKTEVSYE